MAEEERIPIKVKVRYTGVVDALLNGWFLVDTIKFIYQAVEWMLWKFPTKSTSISSSSVSIITFSEMELTVHDKQRFMWLFLDCVSALMIILIEAGAIGLIFSTCIKSRNSLSVRLIDFWIRCNILVATIAIVTFAVRVMCTTFYGFAPIIILIIAWYLSVRYKCIEIAKKYQMELMDIANNDATTSSFHDLSGFPALTT